MKQNLFNKLWLRVGMIVAIMTTALSGTAWAETITIDFENNALPTGWTNNNDMAVVSNPVSSSTNGSYCLSTNGKTSNSLTSGYIENIVSISVDATRTSNNSTNEVYIDFCPNTSFGSSDTQTQSVTVNKNSWSTSTLTLSTKASGYVRVRRSGGNSTATKFIDNIVITCGESGGTPSPSISASNIDILYSATGGNISYSVENSVEGGAVSALVTSGNWLTLGNETTSPISFTCSANNTAAERTATVQLTYTYNTNETVTKDVTVTQAGNPNIVDNISDITAVNTSYKVKGTVVATNSRGFVIGDGTGYVYYYKNAAVDQSVGDKVTISGTTGTYGHIIQFTNTATVGESTTSNYTANTPAATVITEVPDYTQGYHLSTYLEFEGELTKESNSYYITLGDAQIQVSYPTTDQGTALTALNGKTVHVKGYFAGINSSSKFTVMLESVEEVVSTTPTITVSSASLSGFTYEEGSGLSATQTFTVSGANLTENISLSLGGSDFEMSTTEGSGYTNSITLTQSAGTVASTLVYVRLKAGLSANSYNDNITLSSTGATPQTVSLSGSVTAPEAAHVTWDLSTNSYSSASTTEVDWTSSYATMILTKENASSNANAYLNSGNPVTTRFYTGQLLTITPKSGYSINSVEITGVSGYVAGFTGNDWTNASTSTSNNIVTVTPTNGSQAMSVTISATTRATAVTVYYSVTTTPSIAINTTLNVTSDETDGTLEVTYNNIADNSSAEVILCDSEGNTTTYNWIDVDLDNNKDVYYVISANTGAARTGYLKVKVGEVSSDIVTITQGKYTVYNHYTKVTSITSGKHYVIANADGTKAMAGKNSTKDYYDAEDVTVENNRMFVDSESGVQEFVIYGPDADGLYSIYDPIANGYLFASADDSNDLSVQSNNDENGLWEIDFTNETVTAQGTNSHNVLRYNSGSPRFSCYQSGQTAVAFYEKENEATPTESVTVGNLSYATFASDNALDFTSSSIKAFYAKESAGTLSFTQVTKVPAGTGVLLYKDGGATESVPALTGAADAVTGNVFVRGTGAEVTYTVNDQNYILFNGDDGIGFYKANNNTVATNRAYIHVTSSGNDVKSFVINLEDDATGISLMEDGRSQMEDGVIYNLAGQRISKMQKGINIVNGKKILK